MARSKGRRNTNGFPGKFGDVVHVDNEREDAASSDNNTYSGNEGTKDLMDEAANATYIYLMATLDPKLAMPDEDLADTMSTNSQYTAGSGTDAGHAKIVRHGKQWLSSVRNKCTRARTANVKVMANNIDGNDVFIPRYIASQVPPPDATGKELDTVEKIVRFVSLIPFLDDWQAFSDGEMDVWNTSQEFLDLCAGDWEEHALLLCNCLMWLREKLHLNIEIYLVLGSAIPEGDSVYVLVSEGPLSSNSGRDGSKILWNASTGKGYVVKDQNCPLKDVGMLANEENIWANVQSAGEPNKIRWNLNNEKDWLPFWSPSKEQKPSMIEQPR